MSTDPTPVSPDGALLKVFDSSHVTGCKIRQASTDVVIAGLTGSPEATAVPTVPSIAVVALTDFKDPKQNQ